ncbi:MAG: DUF3847 domain-containing protein [Oscillospiraceae bacterium]|nr:DUF3847 domain-containing protein [Oscillospiraceae bacterium]
MSQPKPDKLTALEEKIEQLEKQKKQKEHDRKTRTKRLIERGAILEGLIPKSEDYTNDQIQAFLKRTLDNDFARKALRQINLTRHPKQRHKPTEYATARCACHPA